MLSSMDPLFALPSPWYAMFFALSGSLKFVMLKFSDSAVLREEGKANTRRITVITISSNLSGGFSLPLFGRAKKFISKMKWVGEVE